MVSRLAHFLPLPPCIHVSLYLCVIILRISQDHVTGMMPRLCLTSTTGLQAVATKKLRDSINGPHTFKIWHESTLQNLRMVLPQGTWEGTSSVSNSFNVDWVRRYDLPFRETESMTNPLNENKPIKISRDGQELPLALGLKVCRMFDEGADAAGVPRPPPPGSFSNDLVVASVQAPHQPLRWTHCHSSKPVILPDRFYGL